MLKRGGLVFLLFLFTLSCRRAPEDYLRIGDQFAEQGNRAEAAINYRKAIQGDSRLGEAHLKLGRIELAEQKLPEAYAFFVQAVDLMPDSLEARTALAEICLLQFGRDRTRFQPLFEKAYEMVTAMQAAHPQSFDTLRLGGQIALLSNQPGEAVRLLAEANELRPYDRRVVVPLAESLLATGRGGEAEKLSQEALARDKEFGLVYDFLYAHYVRTKRLEEAEKLLLQKIENNPKQTDYVVQLAGFYAADRQQLDRAKNVLQRMWDNPADFPDGRLKAGDMFLRLRNPGEALRQFQEGLRSDEPRKVEYLKRIGMLQWGQGRHEEAIQVAREAVALAPQDHEARRLRGSFVLSRENPAEMDSVIDDYTLLVQSDPSNHILHYQLGRAYRLKGDRDKAWQHFQEAVKRTRVYLAPRLALAEMSAERGQYTDTLRYLDEITNVDTDNLRVRWLRAATLRNLGRTLEARNELNALLKRHPSNKDLQVELGLLNLSERNFAAAEAAFRKLYKPGAVDVRPAVGLAEALAGQRRIDQATELLSREIALAPNQAGPLVMLADILARAGQIPAAVEHYERALTLNPKDANLHVRRGQLLLVAGRSEDGLASLRRAAELEPRNVGVHLALATSLHAEGKLPEAEAAYEQTRKLDAGNPVLLNNFALLYAETGTNLGQALEMAQKAVAHSPGVLSFTDTLGYVYLRSKRVDSALQVFQSLVAKDGENPTYRLHLGMALLEKGDRVKARDELEAALANSPSTKEEQQIRELLAKV